MGSTGALINGLSRILWSSALDFFSFNKVYRTLVMIQILMIATLLLSTENKYLFFLNVCLSMMCEGAITSILPTETITHFGEKRGPAVYSFMFSSFGVSAIIGSAIVSQLQYEIGFPGMLTICMVLTVMALLLTFVYDSKQHFRYRRYYKPQQSVPVQLSN